MFSLLLVCIKIMILFDKVMNKFLIINLIKPKCCPYVSFLVEEVVGIQGPVDRPKCTCKQ